MQIPKHPWLLSFSAALLAVVCGISTASLLPQDLNGAQTAHGASQELLASKVDHVLIASPIREDEWLQFLTHRNELYRRTLKLHLPEELAHFKPEGWQIRIMDHSHWVIFRKDGVGTRAMLDRFSINQFLKEEIEPLLPAPENATILSLPQVSEFRAEVEGKAKDGWIVARDAADKIVRETDRGSFDMEIPITFIQGRVRGAEGTGIGKLTLLGVGKSNYLNSIPNRIANIELGMDGFLNHLFVPKDDTLNFNQVIGEPISINDGWKIAMGIFDNGKEIRETLGGGICQTSTTMFRALAAAGIPTPERSNHSMYISYYTAFGEGLDAAVYSPNKNLVAENNTPGPLFFQAYTTEDQDAFVEVYGIPDRSVTLEGPYRAHDAPDDLRHENGRGLGLSEIAWRQTIEFDDGHTEENLISSRFVTEIPWWPSKNAGELPTITKEKVNELVYQEEIE